MLIRGGRALVQQDILDTFLQITDCAIASVGTGSAHAPLDLDASGLLVMPGIVDIHGDAFERQMMPRPGVDFPIDVALLDSDRQAIANGLTTVFHATTWSWEPGLRSGDNAEYLVGAIEAITRTIGRVNEIAGAIASAVEEQGAATREIAHNVAEAARSTGEVSSNILGVDEAARETGVAAGKVVEAASELSHNGDTLKDEVGRFMRDVRAA